MLLETTRIVTSLIKVFRTKNQQQMASSFIQVLNPMTGKSEWAEHDDNEYDYHAEIANAGFGDMLHDWERNQKYFAALKKTITRMHKEGRKVHVLDIGTGTGILSMMALQAGADTVTACEAFLPMANCAEQIFAANRVGDKVHLIKKRSNEIKIGKDMQRKANLLVTELLDTELIGEGAINIYNHAHEELLTDDVICIPARATCYAQVVQSPLASQWNGLKTLANLDGEVLLKPSKQILTCKGEAALHDVQLSQIPLTQFRPLAAPVKIFEFDFNSKTARPTKRQHNLRVQVKQPGSTDLVFYWWDIKMDLDGEIELSCAPYWAHPDLKELAPKQSERLPLPNVVPWRDHWMQAIYYIPKPLQLHKPNSDFILSCNHDEYSMWFDAFAIEKTSVPELSVPRHTCSCGLHMTYARNRIAQLNQSTRNKRFLHLLEGNVTKQDRFLVLGDGCVLGLAAAKLGASSVLCLEPNTFSRRFLTSLIDENQLEDIVKVVDSLAELSDSELSAVTHVFAEPYFLSAILPWDNFYLGNLLQQIQQKLNKDVRITPCSARVYALPVEFLDLHKIRTPVVNCEGFDLKLFDEMVEESMDVAQSKVEAQPLWEYPCLALGEPQEILNIDFRCFHTDKSNDGAISLACNGCCNGVALWVDWHLDNSSNAKAIVSTGPTEPVEPGKFIKWDMFVRQGVHFVPKPKSTAKSKAELKWEIGFQPKLGQIKFKFRLNHINDVR